MAGNYRIHGIWLAEIDIDRGLDIWVIDQVRDQDGWILARFFFFWVLLTRKKERDQYPAILFEQA